MEFILIKEGCPEWDYMWGWLHDHPYNRTLPIPTQGGNQGEAWQYMGSFKNGERVVHEFRHRRHPLTNGVIELKVSGSELFNADSIEPKK